MKKLFIIAPLLFLCSFLLGQGIEFFHGTWNEALEEASKQGKIIFVDAYAVWCGPCKRMAKNTFTNKEVGDFYNQNFINMKLDMERGEGLTFRKKYPVSAFPTLYFIDADGEVVQKAKGALDANRFLNLGRTVLGNIDNSGKYAEAYENGDRDPELIYNYVQALNQAGKPSLKIANEYLLTQKDLTSEFNLLFIFEAAVEADSRIFNLMTQHKDKIIALESEEAFHQKVYNACNATAKKANEFQIEELLDEAKTKMAKFYPDKSEEFAIKADLTFYKETRDIKNYLKASKSFAKKIAQDDASLLHEAATNIQESFKNEDKAMKMAEKYAEKAAENGGLAKYYLTYAEILYQNGKSDDALQAANQSLELASENPTEKREALFLIEKINAG